MAEVTGPDRVESITGAGLIWASPLFTGKQDMRLIAYVRVSTAEQDSLAAQESSIRRYCEALGHDLTDVYSDKAS